MKTKAGYQSVSQMARGMTEGDFADEFDKRIRRRKIVKDLMVLRARRGLSQGAVAQKMGCTQSRISKLESSEDQNLSLGDLASYASAVGFRLGVVMEPQETTAVDRVKWFAFQIKHQLDRLAELARDDQEIARAAAGFFDEALFNLVRILQNSARKLPCDPEDGEPLISFEIIRGEAESRAGEKTPEPEPPARRPGRGTRKGAKRVAV